MNTVELISTMEPRKKKLRSSSETIEDAYEQQKDPIEGDESLEEALAMETGTSIKQQQQIFQCIVNINTFFTHKI